jgi:ATP-binding cassette subfamily B protein
VTHDIEHAATFDRVVVVQDGRLVEDGAPDALLARADSRFGAMLAAERSVRAEVWSSTAWRRLRIEAGRIEERGSEGSSPRPTPGPAEAEP